MREWLRFLRKRLKTRNIYRRITRKNQGVALILTLLILLTLVLLGLALLLQTDTEYLISVNEQDSIDAFHYTEAGLIWTKRRVIDVAAAGGFTSFSDLLNGPDNADAVDDNLLGLRTIDATLTETTDLVDDNEQVNSVIVTRDFGDGSKTYEAFKWGINESGDAEWEGPRAVIYVRIDDNYDEYPSTNLPQTDADKIITGTVVSEYPIFVNADGVETPGTRTIARRQLTARFGSDHLQPAIISDRSINFNGNMKLCGECGSAHANVNMQASGNPDVCENLTASGTGTSTENVDGEQGGGYDAIDVPTINPYDDVFVPAPGDFNGSSYGCNSSTPKYFALVVTGSQARVYKAYWNTTAKPKNPAGHWRWRLIDVLNDGNNTILDDCGRLVSGNVGGALTPDSGVGTGVNDGTDAAFYGFKPGGTAISTMSCSGDVSLCSTCDISENDFNIAKFYDTAGNLITDSTLPVLPGSFEPDGVRDFSQSKLKEGEPKWDYDSDWPYSPVFNAVIFIHGEFILGKDTPKDGKICDATGCAGSAPDGVWKASFIVVGNLNVSGSPRVGPANSPAYPFLFVGGRDMGISGNSTGSTTKCGTSDTCAVQAGNSTTYAGIIAAHEQVKFNGNPSFDGFIIIEDAVDCGTGHQRSGGYQDFSGDPQIHYDCENPPNPWAGKVKLTSWQEVQ